MDMIENLSHTILHLQVDNLREQNADLQEELDLRNSQVKLLLEALEAVEAEILLEGKLAELVIDAVDQVKNSLSAK